MKKGLFIANTPFELYYLSSVAQLLKEKTPSFQVGLLIREEVEKALSPEIRSIFSKIHITAFPTLTFKLSKNPFTLFWNFVQNFQETLQFRQFLKRFPFSDIDFLCISSFREFFANMICKDIPKHIRLVALRMANQKLEELPLYKRRPILSFLLNLKNLFFGYSLMNYKFRTDIKQVAEKMFKKYPYYITIAITDWNIGKENKIWRLLPPFIALKKLYQNSPKNEKPGILLVGERTPIHKSWKETDQKKYEAFIRYLQKEFSDHQFFFKPRKGLTDVRKLPVEKFIQVPEDTPLEDFCLRHNIKKVIAIKSTAVKVGAYLGIPSYWLYPLFQLDKTFVKIFEAYCDDLRESVIRVKRSEDIKKEPPILNQDIRKLTQMYQKVILS